MIKNVTSSRSRRIVGPFNRVEGDLEVQLEVCGNRVEQARVVSPLYRGFEQILQGKHPLDSLIYVPRICGICSVSQSIAAAHALANLAGLEQPPNGELAKNLILANENLADHLTHFYLFFMPDFARDGYCDQPWHAKTVARFKAVTGSAAKNVLPARAGFLHLMGILAGKWPHSLAVQPGGVTRAIDNSDKSRLLTLIYAFRAFLETVLFGDSLEAIIALDSAAQLTDWFQNKPAEHSDFCRFLSLSDALQLDTLGRAHDRFMSYGAYPDQGQDFFKDGVFDLAQNTFAPLNQNLIREDVSHSWMQTQPEPAHPFSGVTLPSQNNSNAYSWCKSPRLNGQPIEVGALARLVVQRHPLIEDLVRSSGGNVRNRVIARLLEMAIITCQMEHWVKHIRLKEPFCLPFNLPDEAQGCGMIEAARGSLGHWLKIKRGHIVNYQIIAPTTWNFSPRDQHQVPGALELALQGAPLRDEEVDQPKRNPLAVQHIVRSFDPCMVCTVH